MSTKDYDEPHSVQSKCHNKHMRYEHKQIMSQMIETQEASALITISL